MCATKHINLNVIGQPVGFCYYYKLLEYKIILDIKSILHLNDL